MSIFRSITPKRRSITTAVSRHQAHRDDLRLDFNQRCGYCDDWDYYKTTYYEVDHFVPEDVMVTMSNTDYSNLVYACRSCNNAKRAKWPSKDEKLTLVNDEGFIDPCDQTYQDHFERDGNGKIIAKTKTGKWMYVALKLSKPQHEIIYQLETLDKLIDGIQIAADQNPSLEGILAELLKKYRRYTRELREI